MSDCEQWIEAAVAHQRRAERAEHDLAAARAHLERYEKAIQRFERAATEYHRANNTGEQPRLNKAGTAYAIAKSALFKAVTPETKP